LVTSTADIGLSASKGITMVISTMLGLVSLLVHRTAKRHELDELVNALRNEQQKTVNLQFIVKHGLVEKMSQRMARACPPYVDRRTS
jgi:hypothetical protein